MTIPNLGSKTTADEALGGAKLAGKTAIVTGANSGIGTETARVLARGGADVILACRSAPAGEACAAKLRRELPAGSGALSVQALDLADLASVRAFAAAFIASGRPLHTLASNAGVMATPLGKTAQGSEMQVGTNHVGPFLLTKLLRPVLEGSAPSRIVNVSSGLHTRGKGERLLETLTNDAGYASRKYSPFDAYGDSKLANVLFTRQLAKVLPKDVEAFALHPGVIPTNLSRHMGFMGVLFQVVGKVFMKTVAQGAATSVFAAVDPSLYGKSGAYLSDCAATKSSRDGRDDALAAKLWDVTAKLVA